MCGCWCECVCVWVCGWTTNGKPTTSYINTLARQTTATKWYHPNDLPHPRTQRSSRQKLFTMYHTYVHCVAASGRLRGGGVCGGRNTSGSTIVAVTGHCCCRHNGTKITVAHTFACVKLSHNQYKVTFFIYFYDPTHSAYVRRLEAPDPTHPVLAIKSGHSLSPCLSLSLLACSLRSHRMPFVVRTTDFFGCTGTYRESVVCTLHSASKYMNKYEKKMEINKTLNWNLF